MIRRLSTKNIMVANKLYKMGRSVHMLRCLEKGEVTLVLTEVYEGVCGSHNRGRTLENKLLRISYYWTSMIQDNAKLVNRCDKWQQFFNLHHAPSEVLHPVNSPSSFYQWRGYLVAPSQLKFLLVEGGLIHQMYRNWSVSQNNGKNGTSFLSEADDM